MAPVQPDIGRPGPLRVDAEHATPVQYLFGRVQCPLRLVPSSAVQWDLARCPKEPGSLPVVEVLGFGHIGHPAPHYQRKEERVAKGLVSAGKYCVPVGGNLLSPYDLDPPEQEQDRGQDPLEYPVSHGPRYRCLCCTALHGLWTRRRAADCHRRSPPGTLIVGGARAQGERPSGGPPGRSMVGAISGSRCCGATPGGSQRAHRDWSGARKGAHGVDRLSL